MVNFPAGPLQPSAKSNDVWVDVMTSLETHDAMLTLKQEMSVLYRKSFVPASARSGLLCALFLNTIFILLREDASAEINTVNAHFMPQN